ncbi:MAG: FAD-dependent oxidoreductase [Alphaproteobacteria bacterium]|nr:FAD-dependent oxidoreductase [Alphaproteobacteria bacterium]
MKSPFFNRRKLLKTALFTSAAFMATPLGRAKAQALSGKKVIVVGSGVSGLTAAKTLKNQGAEVIVLEAKPHIGGRLRTDWSMGAPFEVGAGWIHGPSDDNPAKQLADAVGSQYVVTDDDSLVVFDGTGEEISEEDLEDINDSWTHILDQIDESLENGDRRSVLEAINDVAPGAMSEPGVAWAMSAYTEFSTGAPIENLSAYYFNSDKAFDLPDVAVTTGYDKLLGPLAEGLDIKLSTLVQKIAYDDEGVTVATDKGEFTGDYVVSSLPLGALKAKTVTFDPPLPEDHQSNIDNLAFGTVTKLALKFKEPFWDIETQYFGVMTQEKGRWNYWLNYRTFSDENILLGLSVGAYAPVADKMTEAEQIADGMAVLRDVWGEAVTEPVQVLSTHWAVDPHTFGAYAYIRPGGSSSQCDDLADPIEDRLFFCGEHTIFDYKGTIHGAYMTGLIAAEHVSEAAEG